MALYANFDDAPPEKKVGVIGKKEWDFTEMPLDVTLFINRRQAERKREGLQMLMEDYFDALLMWIQTQDADVNAEWLTRHLSGSKLQQIVIPVFLMALNPPLVQFAEKTAIKGGKSQKPNPPLTPTTPRTRTTTETETEDF